MKGVAPLITLMVTAAFVYAVPIPRQTDHNDADSVDKRGAIQSVFDFGSLASSSSKGARNFKNLDDVSQVGSKGARSFKNIDDVSQVGPRVTGKSQRSTLSRSSSLFSDASGSRSSELPRGSMPVDKSVVDRLAKDERVTVSSEYNRAGSLEWIAEENKIVYFESQRLKQPYRSHSMNSLSDSTSSEPQRVGKGKFYIWNAHPNSMYSDGGAHYVPKPRFDPSLIAAPPGHFDAWKNVPEWQGVDKNSAFGQRIEIASKRGKRAVKVDAADAADEAADEAAFQRELEEENNGWFEQQLKEPAEKAKKPIDAKQKLEDLKAEQQARLRGKAKVEDVRPKPEYKPSPLGRQSAPLKIE